MPNAQCPMPNAPCPMPHAQCPMPHAPCISTSIDGKIDGRVASLLAREVRGN
ncbi:histidine kinase [Calothrix sp. NIES-2100]|uniref:histidine kinase n=1 Tax=Calothrix sp. NIES-2100 TaxID=1954172 RepID=UPI0030D99A54